MKNQRLLSRQELKNHYKKASQEPAEDAPFERLPIYLKMAFHKPLYFQKTDHSGTVHHNDQHP